VQCDCGCRCVKQLMMFVCIIQHIKTCTLRLT
jgi:hypothetical protein